MALKLDGKRAADRMLKRLARQVPRRPALTLATILVGRRFDSALYVRLKSRAADRVGIRTEPHVLPAAVSQANLHRLIQRLNRRRGITGILLQLPLPRPLNADQAVSQIDPRKDVDGFHPANHYVVPPPVAAVVKLWQLARPKRRGIAVILAKPSVFGQRMALEMARRRYQVRLVQPIKRIPPIARAADVLITALGQGPMVRARNVKPGAIVIDVGTRRHGRHVIGDVRSDVWHCARAISPVPGGVGPLTVACLLYNTFKLSTRR